MARIRLPHSGWTPRHYQLNLWSYLEGGGKRAMAVWHRRAGKDDVALHWSAIAAHQQVGNYWHCLPEYSQARKAIWEAVSPHTGKRRIDEAFPLELRETTLNNEMFIRFKNGSTWQVIGSDNYQSLVGTTPNGIVFSEWAKAHPGAWAYLAPILEENNGWAAFITTPEGRNHAHAMLEMARKRNDWFAEVQTAEDTGAISQERIENQRAEYHTLFGADAGDALIEQEYYCSFSAAILGAYYGKQITQAEHQGRLCSLDVVPGYPINSAWDIGVDDPMAIWVFQVGPGWLHILDYIEGSNQGFDFYCDWLAERGYVPQKDHLGQLRGVDWVPHDAKMREAGAPGARTRIQTLFALGRNPKLVPDHKPMDRINAGRKLLAAKTTHFDAERCSIGLEMLRAYKQEWDQKNRVFRKTAKHDFASHGSDAWGHLSVAVEQPKVKAEKPAPQEIKPSQITVNDLLRNSKHENRWI